MTLKERIVRIGNKKFEEPNFSDKVLNVLFLWVLPKSVRPNHLTIFRYLTIPFIFYFLLNKIYLIGLMLFFISASSDALDGALARTRKQITAWGKAHDPLADKLLIGVSGAILVTRYISVEVIFVILFLEALTIIVALLLYDPKVNPGARLPGKIKMLCQAFGLGAILMFLVLGLELFLSIALMLLYSAIVFSLINILFCIFITKSI